MDALKKAEIGLELLKEAIVDKLGEHPEGLRNVEIAEGLDIHSDYRGEQQDYLSWSLLGMLMDDGRVERVENKYFVADESSD